MVTKYLNHLSTSNYLVEKLNTGGSFSSFRLTVPNTVLDTIMKTQNWNCGVRLKTWIYRRPSGYVRSCSWGCCHSVLDDLRSSFIPVDLKPYTTELSLECCAVELVTNKAIFITLYRTDAGPLLVTEEEEGEGEQTREFPEIP
ncbi:unnamed protein product [Acanthoscelides obtectus]|uniref:Uncharacterized protein n=1 Tax=Acanthoscelides obtectus TaxID=200917 RepID=A0A9P0LLL5_ACAOB|nr:unnamed protein product [Acanthoscelides obtectus]CAK1651453.1 hypothetical protein AOBTE_LOCUS17288 [Acanthoscelides obtectus]